MRAYRQGDVLVVEIAALPAGIEPMERSARGAVLAEGEATGHAHAIRSERAALFNAPGLGAVFMRVSGEAVALEHDEHDSIVIPPGDYEIIRQVEYTPQDIRNVAD
jgi:hypothetical protein